jgi:hypothetical protein
MPPAPWRVDDVDLVDRKELRNLLRRTVNGDRNAVPVFDIPRRHIECSLSYARDLYTSVPIWRDADG